MNIRYQKHPSSLLREWQKEWFPLATWLAEANPAAPESTVWTPKVDIKEEKDKFVVFVDVPGVEAKDIDIEVDGNVLTVKGEREATKEEKNENYYRLERVSGKFCRQLALPDTVDDKRITATTKQGVLMINLPKTEEKQQRKITVQEE